MFFLSMCPDFLTCLQTLVEGGGMGRHGKITVKKMNVSFEIKEYKVDQRGGGTLDERTYARNDRPLL
jgi:hypothetical protein